MRFRDRHPRNARTEWRRCAPGVTADRFVDDKKIRETVVVSACSADAHSTQRDVFVPLGLTPYKQGHFRYTIAEQETVFVCRHVQL